MNLLHLLSADTLENEFTISKFMGILNEDKFLQKVDQNKNSEYLHHQTISNIIQSSKNLKIR